MPSTSTVSWVFIGGGRWPITFENQMKKNGVARNGNQRAAVLTLRLWPVMLVLVRS